MGCAGRSTESALLYILELIRAAWKRGRQVFIFDNVPAATIPNSKFTDVSILSIDIAAAYPNVNRAKLIAILQKKGIPQWLVDYIKSFFDGQQTTISIPGHHDKNKFRSVDNGIPQGSALSPILFLLFSSPLLEEIEEIRTDDFTQCTHGVAYVDDTYIIAISRSIKINCRMLGNAHEKCIEWAREDGVRFSPSKSYVIHFTRDRNQMRHLLPSIPGFTKKNSEASLRILGVILDSRLNFQDHIENVGP